MYVPPEVDLPAGREGALPETPKKEPPRSPEAISPGDRTQAMEPVPDAGRVRVPQVICPECYARNPEGNRYCQECGNPLPAFSGGRPEARRPAAAGAARQPTAALPVRDGGEAPGEPYGDARREPERTRPERWFGASDVVATTAALLLSAALVLPFFLESFSYKKGMELGMFSHQGAYVRGAYELLGGPGLLPYRGTEFLTVGLVLALGLFLALLFLMVRTGRGPMYVLAGCLVVLPLAYLFFQAVLPLQEKGVEIEPALGLGRLFFGGDGAPGLGPTVWMACAAAALLILAGFLAPPRGWGRFFTFLTFFSFALGAGFLCAACYNWNLFISGTAAATYGGMAFL
ncbi:MAG: zinc-ribbon domain-containing protein [Actinomycetota bacterium]